MFIEDPASCDHRYGVYGAKAECRVARFMHDPVYRLPRMLLFRRWVHKDAAWWPLLPPRMGATTLCSGVHLSCRQLADELFEHGQVVIHVLAGGGHRDCRSRADERLPHPSVGEVDALEEV